MRKMASMQIIWDKDDLKKTVLLKNRIGRQSTNIKIPHVSLLKMYT
jgi:hypothetical protein